MNAKAIETVVLTVAYLVCRDLAAGPPSVALERRSALLKQLGSRDSRAAGEAWSRLIPEREGTILALMEIARGDDREHRALAIELLGHYRAIEALALLVEQIESPPLSFGSFPDTFRQYPAAKALLRIGEPAMQEILGDRMYRPATENELRVFAYVLWYHHRAFDEQELGLRRMQRLLDRERARVGSGREKSGTPASSQREKNLARLIEIYRNISPHTPLELPPPPGKR